jgi:tetrahedral aminopeptidase
MKPLIKKLVETFGPSGYENAVRDLVHAEITGHVDDIHIDPLGNLIARKFQKSADGLRVMICGHIDEIGLMASFIDENGFVRFSPVGGVYPINCVHGRVRFANGAHGVIGMERQEKPEVPSLDKLFIDVGATSRNDCPVKVGDIAAFERPYMELGNRLVSKAMDDRISTAILIETLRQIKQSPNELFFVFSVQEELGLRGATTAAYGVQPDLALSVDVTRSGDTPKGIKMDVHLGKGPAIKVRDSGMISDRRVVDWMIKTAEENDLPYQLEVLEAGTTDATAIQTSRAGVPSSCISIGCRYIHSPSEMVDINDVQNAVKLLVKLLSSPILLE